MKYTEAFVSCFSERNLPINFLFQKVDFLKYHLWVEETVKQKHSAQRASFSERNLLGALLSIKETIK